MRAARLRKLIVRPILGIVAVAIGYVAWNQANGNFGEAIPGRLYRSSQMSAGALGQTVRSHKIRTVLNLRGSHPDLAWYRDERAATLRAGATQVDMAMSSCDWMSRAQLAKLVEVLDTADYPILVHCWHGAERTGLVSAVSELLRPGSTLADARAHFTIKHLFVKAGDGKVMPEHVDQYERWLLAHKLEHDPGRFRRWIAEGFRPGTPSREQWPYDPYPLTVITRPDGTSTAVHAPRDSTIR